MAGTSLVERYIASVAKITQRGDAREESYYSVLAKFLEGYSESSRGKKIDVTILPKKTEAGNPDLRVWDGRHSQVGYVEVKPPKADLDRAESSGQLERYIETFPNLILTNLYEFRLYRNGRCIEKVLIARPFIAEKLKTVPPVEGENEFLLLLEKFFSFVLPTKFTAETLATELAIRTRFLRDEVIKEELKEASTDGGRKILGFYEAFQKHLISNLKPDEFADLYAQTITYGLFAARTRADGQFNRKLAYDLIPKTIGVLRDIFYFISYDAPPQLEATVDDIAEVLAVADAKNILHQYFKEGKGSDPIFHFYETFLAAYNPKERERRGVYYTPEPVVSFIVRSLNVLLKEKFGREDGFATSSVTLLDPAGGTLTFLAEAAKLAVQEFVEKYGSGSKGRFVEDHILKHFFAFELMMAPYAAGHLKMSFLLEELGHKLTGNERFQFYLTNTLEMEELAQTTFPGMASLSEESHLAGRVKKETPILVVLGNPPYSGHSSNRGDWITAQIEYYKSVDGKPLGERNPKWLQDDYVKFIRFAQWKIDSAGEGILGFITNHSYLDNPTFRGMRRSLMTSFDEIYILDLHGNSLKKEKAPDGSKDENVFDIQQGVAIGLFIKHKRSREKKIHHAELWGDQERKYSWLEKHDLTNTRWKTLKPASPLYLFVPRDERLSKRYYSYPCVQEIFPVNSVGIVTARDALSIRLSKEDAWKTVLNFVKLEEEMARQAYRLGPDARDWKVGLAQEDLRSSGPRRENIVPILYRPFDHRYTYYTGHSRGFHCMPRGQVMQHLLQENLALVVPKRVETAIPWSHVFVAREIIEHVAVSLKTIDYCFPLYTYQELGGGGAGSAGGRGYYQAAFVFESPGEYASRKPNLNSGLLERLRVAFGKTPSPEDVFFYIYAILYSPAYRKKYAEFLKLDFPRIPFTRDTKLFRKLVDKGEQLVQLHTLKSTTLNKPTSKCEGEGDLIVEKVTYDQAKKRVYLNATKYFARVTEEVWEYHVGAYQVAEKWLKDRKGRTLSAEEVSHYCKILTALEQTWKVQQALDSLFELVESSTIDLDSLTH